jgi:hypothetical protein
MMLVSLTRILLQTTKGMKEWGRAWNYKFGSSCPPPLPPFKMPHILYILPHSVVTCWQLWPHAMVLVHWDEQDHGGFWLHRFCCSTFPQ